MLLCGVGLWLCVLWAVGCQSATGSGEAEVVQESWVPDSQDELLPIVDEEPPAQGDIRRLHNCAESPFTKGGPGSWEGFEGLETARGAKARHRTSDRVVPLGEPIELKASIEYDTGALAGEWVRIYVGDCDGWELKGINKTDEEGRVAFRLADRLAEGVYGVVFQVAGDQSEVRSQLWVVSRKTEVVVLDLSLAAGGERIVEVDAMREVAKCHTSRGHLVAYINGGGRQEGQDSQVDLDEWRQALREEQVAVGPIVDLSVGGGDAMRAAPVRGQGDGEWGRAAENAGGGPPLPRSVARVYSANPVVLRLLEEMGVEAQEVLPNEDGMEK